MPAFLLVFDDDPAFTVSDALRAEHAKYFLGRGSQAIIGGPTFDDQQQVSGRVLVAEFPSIHEARAWAADEPLVKVGRVKAWRLQAMAVVQKDGVYTPVGR